MRPGLDTGASLPFTFSKSSLLYFTSPLPISASTEMTERSLGSIMDGNLSSPNTLVPSPQFLCTWISPVYHPAGSGRFGIDDNLLLSEALPVIVNMQLAGMLVLKDWPLNLMTSSF